ncbi:MAG: nuclear transport factor 2 family protein [Gemmatimonadota bacterium]|nr:MAG: nuclear transport factor 2 family protein [Gemmatimonadota bacterium]
MKRILVTTLMTAVAVAPGFAQTSARTEQDEQAVIAAALDYMEGALNADAERMARGVHPELTKVVVGTYRQSGRQYLAYNTSTLLVEWTRGAAEQMANADKNVDVTVFDIGDNLAAARAIGQTWYDFLQLAKIDGQWRIVNVLWARNRLQAEDQSGVQPEPTDRAEIEATALNYIDGSFSGDAERMEKALHPELTKMLLTNNRVTGKPFLHKMGASDLIEGTRAGLGMVDEDQRGIEVEIYDVSHGIAAVKVTSSRYIDHLQMGKVNGEWKIINVLWVPNPNAPSPGG